MSPLLEWHVLLAITGIGLTAIVTGGALWFRAMLRRARLRRAAE